MDAKSVRNMQSNIAVTNKHTAKLHPVGSLYILTRQICSSHSYLPCVTSWGIFFFKTKIWRNILSMYSSKQVIGYISYYYISLKKFISQANTGKGEFLWLQNKELQNHICLPLYCPHAIAYSLVSQSLLSHRTFKKLQNLLKI